MRAAESEKSWLYDAVENGAIEAIRVDTVLRPNHSGYELQGLLGQPHPCHLGTIHPHRRMAPHTYSGKRPDLPCAREFYDRWLPGTMRRISEYTQACVGQCSMSRRPPSDWIQR
jgi:hypothetical protein